jgi:hypothetical protein
LPVARATVTGSPAQEKPWVSDGSLRSTWLACEFSPPRPPTSTSAASGRAWSVASRLGAREQRGAQREIAAGADERGDREHERGGQQREARPQTEAGHCGGRSA